MLVPEIFNPEVLPTESKEGRVCRRIIFRRVSSKIRLQCPQARRCTHETTWLRLMLQLHDTLSPSQPLYTIFFQSGGMDSEIKHLKSGLSKLQEAATAVCLRRLVKNRRAESKARYGRQSHGPITTKFARFDRERKWRSCALTCRRRRRRQRQRRQKSRMS